MGLVKTHPIRFETSAEEGSGSDRVLFRRAKTSSRGDRMKKVGVIWARKMVSLCYPLSEDTHQMMKISQSSNKHLQMI